MKFLFITIIILVNFSCHNNDLLLYKQDEIKGRILVENNFTESPRVSAPEALIYLSKKSQVNKYLFSTKADKDGKFILSYQPASKQDINLTVRYNGADGIYYEGIYSLDQLPDQDSKGEYELLVSPQYTKGVIKVIMKEANANNTPITGAEVYLFTNLNQAATIKETSPQGVVTKAVTNLRGVAFFSNLEDGDYWIAAKLGTQLTNPAPVSVKASSSPIKDISSIQINSLTFIPATKKSDIIVTVLDKRTGEFLTNFQVYLFTALTQAGTINDDEVKGYVQLANTDAKGEASLKQIDPGTYYIAASGAVAGIKKITKLSTNPIVIPSNSVQVIRETLTIE